MNTKGFRVGAASILLALFLGTQPSRGQTVKTPAEESRYTQYSQHEEIARFLSALDFSSQETAVEVIGKTREVKDFPARDLFLAIITEEGTSSPEKLNRAKPTIFLFASQHGREQSAKEAALRLSRDLAIGELRPLLKQVNFLIIPQANPYGSWFDRRENEQGLDLNRDHVKLESEETRAIHRVFREWLPEVTIDVHEKGDDYYRVSIGCVSNVNIDVRLQEFSRSKILTDISRSLEKRKLAFHEYLVTEEMGLNTSAGANLSREDLAGREEMKRYSTTDLNDGRNSLGIYETLSFIQECSSRHDLATLEERTRWQYQGLRAFSEAVAAHSAEILPLVRESRAALLDKTRAYSETDLIHLRMEYVRDEKQPTLTLKKFENAESPVRGILKVDKKAGEPVLAADIAPAPYPSEYKLVTEVVKNWFPDVAVRLSVPRPLGYFIPAGHQDVVDCLLAHGIKVGLLTKDLSLDVEAYTACEVEPSKYDYLPPAKLELEKKEVGIVAKKGDYFVSCRQPAANLIPCLLDPQSDYGLIRYWTFKLVPEAGDIFAFYRVVKPLEIPVIPYRNFGYFFSVSSR
jgi:hypothetical protein